MNWGYGGDGPADTALSLLLHALGDPQCTACAGSGCDQCDHGAPRVPYQRFKWEFVTHWGPQWQMSRAQVLAWLVENGAPARRPR